MIYCLTACENCNSELTPQFQIKIDLIFLCGVLSHVSVVFRLQLKICLLVEVSVWGEVTETEHVDIVFPALKLYGFKYSDCILNSITALKKSDQIIFSLCQYDCSHLEGCQKFLKLVQPHLRFSFILVELPLK